MEKGLLVIFSGPSGAGKDTVLDIWTEKDKNTVVSISMTTREKRENEIDGVNYYFVSKDTFESNIRNGKMLEYAEYCGNYYGTPKDKVDELLSEGKTVILKIEVQGAENIRRLCPEAVSIFIMPPSMEILKERLANRGSETEETLKKRLDTAKQEIKQAEKYDYIVINDELETAVSDAMTIVKAEKMKVKNNTDKVREVIENV